MFSERDRLGLSSASVSSLDLDQQRDSSSSLQGDSSPQELTEIPAQSSAGWAPDGRPPSTQALAAAPAPAVGAARPKRPSSQRKIEANRRNALKSTGPRTAAGKAVVRYNALKHGFLARQVVTSSPESAREFEELVDDLRQNLQPVGRMEELLVEEIALCYWKKCRAIRSEVGQMRLRLAELLDLRISRYTGVTRPNAEFISLKAGLLVDAGEQIQRHGAVSEKTSRQIKSFFQSNTRLLEHLLGPKAFSGSARREIMEEIRDQVDVLHYEHDQQKERENWQAEAVTLPAAENLDLILRYEAAAERQLYRALAQLERLQRQRKGEYVPPPVKVAVEAPGRD